MPNPISVVKQGASFDFKFALDNGGLVTDWTCTITAKQYPDDAATISRVVPADENVLGWTGFLTATETSTLALGLWYLTGTKANATTGELEEGSFRIHISKPWV